jgi:spore maturation protein CgeB
MRIAMFYHSLLSDWNHGNAHFLRGVANELVHRGHDVRVYEPLNAWSLQNLVAEHGAGPIDDFRRAYPNLDSTRYDPATIDLDHTLEDADLVLVHEWNDPILVHRVGRHHANGGRYRLLFHDTHHRAFTQPSEMARYDLEHYDGVLAFGKVLANLYLKHQWTRRAWTWHEAADTRLFRPITGQPCEGDLVWVGNWGDGERTAELREFLLEPVRALKLKTRVHGVRYPDHATAALADAGIEYAGWLPNFRAPQVFSRFKATVHIPRGPYVRALPGIPTIRVFEALACGIPLVCAPWEDVENLFDPGRDYVVVPDGEEMERRLRQLINEPEAARQFAVSGLNKIRSRHTCAHRVDELLEILNEIRADAVSSRRSAHPIPSPSYARLSLSKSRGRG